MKRSHHLTFGAGIITIMCGALGLAYTCVLLFASPDVLHALASLSPSLVPFRPSPTMSSMESIGGFDAFLNRFAPAIFACAGGIVSVSIGLFWWRRRPAPRASIFVWLGAALIVLSIWLASLIFYPGAMLPATVFAVITAILMTTLRTRPAHV